MAVSIGTATTAVYGTAGSGFGSIINLNVTGQLAKTLNTDNFPILAGQLPALAWLSWPVGHSLEFSADGGTTWTSAVSSATFVSASTFLIDGFTTRANGSGTGNWTFVALRAVLA